MEPHTVLVECPFAQLEKASNRKKQQNDCHSDGTTTCAVKHAWILQVADSAAHAWVLVVATIGAIAL